jgi:RND superfamily putative drug exporter
LQPLLGYLRERGVVAMPAPAEASAVEFCEIGRFSYRRRWLVAGVWVLLLVLAGAGAAKLSGTMSNSFSFPGTEAQQAINQLADRFPQAHVGGATARVVSVAPSGATLSTPTCTSGLIT